MKVFALSRLDFGDVDSQVFARDGRVFNVSHTFVDVSKRSSVGITAMVNVRWPGSGLDVRPRTSFVPGRSQMRLSAEGQWPCCFGCVG